PQTVGPVGSSLSETAPAGFRIGASPTLCETRPRTTHRPPRDPHAPACSPRGTTAPAISSAAQDDRTDAALGPPRLPAPGSPSAGVVVPPPLRCRRSFRGRAAAGSFQIDASTTAVAREQVFPASRSACDRISLPGGERRTPVSDRTNDPRRAPRSATISRNALPATDPPSPPDSL